VDERKKGRWEKEGVGRRENAGESVREQERGEERLGLSEIDGWMDG
jgi:hypothetical protein